MSDHPDGFSVPDDPVAWRRHLEQGFTRLRIQRLNIETFMLLEGSDDVNQWSQLRAARDRLDEEAAQFRASLAAYTLRYGPLDLPTV